MSPSGIGSANRSGNEVTPHTFDPSLIATNDDWLEELVCFILLVPLLDGSNRVLRCFALALDQTLGGDLDPLPSLVTIHSVVPTNDGDKLSNLLLLNEVEEFFRILGRRTGSGVTTIAEEVDVDVWDFELFRGLEESKEMMDMGMDSTIRDLQARA